MDWLSNKKKEWEKSDVCFLSETFSDLLRTVVKSTQLSGAKILWTLLTLLNAVGGRPQQREQLLWVKCWDQMPVSHQHQHHRATAGLSSLFPSEKYFSNHDFNFKCCVVSVILIWVKFTEEKHLYFPQSHDSFPCVIDDFFLMSVFDDVTTTGGSLCQILERRHLHMQWNVALYRFSMRILSCSRWLWHERAVTHNKSLGSIFSG